MQGGNVMEKERRLGGRTARSVPTLLVGWSMLGIRSASQELNYLQIFKCPVHIKVHHIEVQLPNFLLNQKLFPSPNRPNH